MLIRRYRRKDIRRTNPSVLYRIRMQVEFEDLKSVRNEFGKRIFAEIYFDVRGESIGFCCRSST